MTLEDGLLKPGEKAVFLLRRLYAENGYTQYKMGKFEEYDLYVRNKDYLISDAIISFTDTNGKLMALKPDVTLSIIRSTKDAPGAVTKLYYNENVYRVSPHAMGFREIMQAGLECIGGISRKELCEVLVLAAKSLAALSDRWVLDVTHLNVLDELVGALGLCEEDRAALLKCVGEKNLHGAAAVCAAAEADPDKTARLLKLLSLHGRFGEVLPTLDDLLRGTPAEAALPDLREAADAFAAAGLEENLRLDFSASCDLKYYNGVAFKGYVDGIPASVLSGGQYDKLMRRMNRASRAVGFAVYLDSLERADETAPKDDWLNVALPKGRLGEKVYAMFAGAGYECPALLENSRKLIFENPEKKVRYFWVKPSDVPIYVERGAADLGVAGKDILLEYSPAVYELLDLDTGKCRMAVAAKKDYEDDPGRTLRVATKFANIARNHYAGKGRDIDVIHLNGSIEIAPILGLSDVIVDIVETGTTLKENDLAVIETITPISARLIANPAGMKFKQAAVDRAAAALAAAVREKQAQKG